MRNGFVQDPALTLEGGDSSRVLVASLNHIKMPLKSDRRADEIKFITIRAFEQPNAVDEELMNYIIKKCPRIVAIDDERIDATKRKKVIKDISQILRKGASVCRSQALHAAVDRDWFPLVEYLLQKDPSALNHADHNGFTPLMMCGITAAGKGNILWYTMKNHWLVRMILQMTMMILPTSRTTVRAKRIHMPGKRGLFPEMMMMMMMISWQNTTGTNHIPIYELSRSNSS